MICHECRKDVADCVCEAPEWRRTTAHPRPKMVALPDFLTEQEIVEAMVLWRDHRVDGTFHVRVMREILLPNMDRINAALGQENSADYLAYAIEHVMMAGHRG
jgi:hypothetical protein